MEPVWYALNSKKCQNKWDAKQKGSMKSAMAGRQFTQTRVKACQWASHDRCLVCLQKIVLDDCPSASHREDASSKKTVKDRVEANDDQLARAPIGNLNHRLWKGACLEELRKESAPPADIRTAHSCDVAGHPAWERALVPRPPMPLRKRMPTETLVWVVKPQSLLVNVTLYTDGSYRDGEVQELGREGWAFTAFDDQGTTVGAAFGVPPPWVKGIEGAEAWALLQALRFSLPAECTYWVDCLPLLTAVGKGPSSALDPKNVLARVHGLIHANLDDDAAKQVGWMPAHLSRKEIGIAKKSNEELVTLQDLRGNTIADVLAKQGADTHRVPASEVALWKALHTTMVERAIWIGVATQAANDHDDFPFKDSEASRWQADAKARARLAKKSGSSEKRRRARKEQQRNVGDNGHEPQVTTFGLKKLWKCGAASGGRDHECSSATACATATKRGLGLVASTRTSPLTTRAKS